MNHFYIDPVITPDLDKIPIRSKTIGYNDFFYQVLSKQLEETFMTLADLQDSLHKFSVDSLCCAKEALMLSLRRKERDKAFYPPTDTLAFHSYFTPSDHQIMIEVPLPECRLSCCVNWSEAKLLEHFSTVEHCCQEVGAELEAVKLLDRLVQKKVKHYRYRSSQALPIIDSFIVKPLLEQVLPASAAPPAPPRRRL